MKRSLLVATVAFALMAPTAVQAASYEPEDSDNPIRLISYPIHFVGKVAEYAISRPITWLASQKPINHWVGRGSNARTEEFAGSRDYELLNR